MVFMQLEDIITKSSRFIDNKTDSTVVYSFMHMYLRSATAISATFKYPLTLLQHKGWSTPQMCRWTCWSSLWPSAASAVAHPGIFDAHCQSTHRYHYLPRRENQRHSCIMKQSTHNPPGANGNRACLSANSPCGNINYGNGVYFKVGVLDRMDNKWLKSQRMAHWCWACMNSFKLHGIPAECCIATNFAINSFDMQIWMNYSKDVATQFSNKVMNKTKISSSLYFLTFGGVLDHSWCQSACFKYAVHVRRGAGPHAHPSVVYLGWMSTSSTSVCIVITSMRLQWNLATFSTFR